MMAPEELLLKKNEPLEPIVGEEAIELRPNGMRIIIILHHRVEKVLGDGEEEPADESCLDGRPLGVELHGLGVDSAVNVLLEVILTEDKVEVGLPCVIGGILLGETDGHAGEDVNVADVLGGNGVEAGEGVRATGEGRGGDGYGGDEEGVGFGLGGREGKGRDNGSREVRRPGRGWVWQQVDCGGKGAAAAARGGGGGSVRLGKMCGI